MDARMMSGLVCLARSSAPSMLSAISTVKPLPRSVAESSPKASRSGSTRRTLRAKVPPSIQEPDAGGLARTERDQIYQDGVRAVHAPHAGAVRSPHEQIRAVLGDDRQDLQILASRRSAQVEDVERDPIALVPEVRPHRRAQSELR